MSESLVGFGTAITAALAPSVPILPPSPIRRMTAVTAVLHLEADWLTLAQQVALIDFLRTDRTLLISTWPSQKLTSARSGCEYNSRG
jgi:hypothetical protein